jgi:hypothetical protein
MLGGILAVWLSYGPTGAPYITNDGYQYLDAASNLAAGQCFCTRVALFDEQIAFGRMPIPFTHFAPGYPLLIAALSRAGISMEIAGYLISALSYLAVLWLIWDIALNLGAQAWVVAVFSLLWIAHATALYYAAVVGAEMLFGALLLLLVALILRDVHSGGSRPFLTAGIGVIAGLSYWIRYPGLFLVAPAGVYLIVRAWRIPIARRGAIAGLIAAAVLIGSIQVRNAIYTGSWRGGFKSAGGRHILPRLLAGTIQSFIHFFTGDRVPVRLDIWSVLFVLSSAALLFFGIQTWRRRSPEDVLDHEALAWLIFVGLAYVGGIFVAALTTIAGDLPRYYFPVYPLLLACAAVACSVLASGLRSVAVIVFVLSAIIMQSRSLFVPLPQQDWILTRSILAEPLGTGVPLVQWLRDHVKRSGAMLSVEGQAVHYVLQRPVVAVIAAGDTARSPDEEGFRTLMRQTRSRYLLVFPGAPPDRIPEQASYGFLRSLAAGETPPWLTLAAQTRDAVVYECPDCETR